METLEDSLLPEAPNDISENNDGNRKASQRDGSKVSGIAFVQSHGTSTR
jgi:hypothetical protein